MMHYQAVASPAGVINDVTHHTILPPLLSITSALVKCTTNFWHNASYVHQHITNTSLHMILQLHMIFYLLVVLVLLCNLLHLFLVTNDHSHTPQMFLPRVHAPQKNQAGTWRNSSKPCPSFPNSIEDVQPALYPPHDKLVSLSRQTHLYLLVLTQARVNECEWGNPVDTRKGE